MGLLLRIHSVAQERGAGAEVSKTFWQGGRRNMDFCATVPSLIVILRSAATASALLHINIITLRVEAAAAGGESSRGVRAQRGHMQI